MSNYGIIRFDSIPSKSTIFIDDQEYGQTPLDLDDAEIGTYTYKLTSEGYKDLEGNLQVYRDRITHVVANFYEETMLEEIIIINNNTNQFITEIPPSITPIIQEPSQTETVPTETVPTETVPTETPPVNTPPIQEQSSSVLDEIIKMNDTLTQINTTLSIPKNKRWYDVTNTILISVPSQPSDPSSGNYQFENVHDILGYVAPLLYIYNNGPGILFIITSNDGKNFSSETYINEGEYKIYNNIYSAGLRSPTANLIYIVTERQRNAISGQIFSGSRFKDRRDRLGVIVFQDDMESATLKFKSTITGVGTTIRSNDTAYSGDFSIKTVTGANPNDNNILKYFHTDFHKHRIGIQIQFASNAGFYSVALTIEYNDGITSYKGNVFVLSNGTFDIIDQNGNNIVIDTSVPLVNEIVAWNSMKLVIDIATKKYVSTIINGRKIDISNFPLSITPLITSEHVETFITTTGPNAGAATTVYYDNYIFTEDES